MTRDKDAYSYPPRGMNRVDSARYVGVGVTKFDEMVFDGRMPKPKHIDSRRVWDRLELDASFSDLSTSKRVNKIDAVIARGQSREEAAQRTARAAALELRKTTGCR